MTMKRLNMQERSKVEISPVSDTKQSFVLKYNQETKNFREKIPLVMRNKETGWPLLQISLFTFNVATEKYEPALGGGHCHDLSLVNYFFATLFTQTFYYDENDKSNDFTFNLSNLITRGKRYHIHTKPPFAFQLEAKSAGAEYIGYSVQLNKQDLPNLSTLLSYISLLVINTKKIKVFDIRSQGVNYTEQEIRENIDQEFCVFYNGQIYIDLGKMLSTRYRLICSKMVPRLIGIRPFTKEDEALENNETNSLTIEDDVSQILEQVFQVTKFKELAAQQTLEATETENLEIAKQTSLDDQTKKLFGNVENKLSPEALSHKILESIHSTNHPLEKLKLLDHLFKAVITKHEIHYEFFRPSMSIFFNNKICNTQKKDIKSIKLAYLAVVRKALLDEKVSIATKQEIIKRSRQKDNLLDYHTKFLFGFTDSRNTFDRLVNHAYRSGYLAKTPTADKTRDLMGK